MHEYHELWKHLYLLIELLGVGYGPQIAPCQI